MAYRMEMDCSNPYCSQVLYYFPAEEQLAALQRLENSGFNRYDAVAWAALDFQNGEVRQWICNHFTKSNNAGIIFDLISRSSRMVYPTMVTDNDNSKSRLEGGLQLFEQLTPYANTPSLKKALEDAQQTLRSRLERLETKIE